MICRNGLAFFLAIAVCSCASKPTVEALERVEIDGVLAKARATDLPTLRTCQALVTDLETKPVAENVARGVAHVVGFVVLFPVLVVVVGSGGGRGLNIDVGPGFPEALANSRANALAGDRIIVRCVVAVSTEQRVGPDHVDMAVPLMRLAEAYQLAGVDPKGPAVQQAQRLFERAYALVEKGLGPVTKDEKYGEEIEGALNSYISLLQRLKRDLRPACCSKRDLQPVCSRRQSLAYVCEPLDDLRMRGPEVDGALRAALGGRPTDPASGAD